MSQLHIQHDNYIQCHNYTLNVTVTYTQCRNYTHSQCHNYNTVSQLHTYSIVINYINNVTITQGHNGTHYFVCYFLIKIFLIKKMIEYLKGNFITVKELQQPKPD